MEDAGGVVPEIIKWILGGGSAGLVAMLAYWLFVRFIKKEVIEPIEEIRELSKKAYRSAEEAKEKVLEASFKMVTRSQDMETELQRHGTNLQKVYGEMSHYAATSRMEVQQAKDELKIFEKQTEEGMHKMTQVGTILLNKVKALQTEQVKLGEEFIMIKNKKGDG